MRWTLLVALASLGCSPSQREAPGGSSRPLEESHIQPELAEALTQRAQVDVIITLREPETSHDISSAQHSIAINELQQGVLNGLEGSGFVLSRRYQHTPAIAGSLTPEGLARLKRDPHVRYVQLDNEGRGQLAEAVPLTGASQLHDSYALTGRGVRVAVLDTGVDAQHPDLQGAIVEEHCFAREGCGPLRLNESSNADDANGHGTQIASVIASRGVVSPRGFAPEAEIVAVKVMDSTGSGYESAWIAALDWVYDNLDRLNVRVVTFSLGTAQYYGADCDRQQPGLTLAINNLVNAGVAVIAASGNYAASAAISAPACNFGAIAVGATYDGAVGPQPPDAAGYTQQLGLLFAPCKDEETAPDQITCFTNTSNRLDLLAPGGPILAADRGGGTKLGWGTSQAAAAVSGIASLLLQCAPGLEPDALKQALTSTGVPAMDRRTMRSYPVVRAVDAMRAVCPDLQPIPPPTPDAGTPSPTPDDAGVATEPPAATAPRSPGALGGRYIGGASASLPADEPGRTGTGARGGTRGRDAAIVEIPLDSAGPLTPSGAAPASAQDDGCSCRAAGGGAGHSSSAWIVAAAWLVMVTRRARARVARARNTSMSPRA